MNKEEKKPSPKFILGENKKIHLVLNDRTIPVRIHPCFPWRDPGRFISVCGIDGEEILLIHATKGLEGTSKQILQQALLETRFTLTIDRIENIKKEVEIRNWTVFVEHQKRTFQTELDEWPQTLSNGSILIRDVAGDFYCVQDPKKLDPKSKKLLGEMVG
ncbi:MAG: DUF1854 domain-containing protein [Kiritimatiellae bacterium]|nr:DUF1854 domain-containing protein [Kiritimatiellia bacterium]